MSSGKRYLVSTLNGSQFITLLALELYDFSEVGCISILEILIELVEGF